MSTQRRTYIVGVNKIASKDRDVAHRVITDEDSREFLDIISANDDPTVPLGAACTYRVELTAQEAAEFQAASNCRYVELDVVDTADNVYGTGTTEIPGDFNLGFMGATFPGNSKWHGRDVPVCIVDGGTTQAVRDYMGWTLANRSNFGPDDPGADEYTSTHGCFTSVCGVPSGGILYDAVTASNSNTITRSQAVLAWKWAADLGVKIVNFSFSGAAGTESSVYQDGVQYLFDRGVQLFCSSGNDGLNQLNTPAGYSTTFANVHSIVSFNSATNIKASSSNYSVNASGVTPGNAVRSLTTDAVLTTFSGTSAAAPHAAHLCARLCTDGTYTAAQAGAALKSSARDTGQPADRQGGGAYDLERALVSLGAIVRQWSIVSGPAGVTPGTVIGTAKQLNWTPTIVGAYTLRYTATYGSGVSSDDVIVNVVGADIEITLNPIDITTDLAGTPASTEIFQIVRPASQQVIVELPVARLQRIVDVDPVNVDVLLNAVVTDANLVVRPLPVDVTTVAASPITYGRQVHPDPVNISPSALAITWPSIIDPPIIDISVQSVDVQLDANTIAQPSPVPPISVTVEQPAAIGEVLYEVEVTVAPIDIAVQPVAIDPASIVDVALVSQTVETPRVYFGRIHDVDVIQVEAVVLLAQAKLTKNVASIPVVVELAAINVELVTDALNITTTIEPLVTTAAKIIELPNLDVTVELPPLTIIRTSYGIAPVDVSVTPTLTKTAAIIDVAAIDITVQTATLDFYRASSVRPVDISPAPLEASLIQSAYGLSYIDIVVEPVPGRIVREFDVDPINITTYAETAGVSYVIPTSGPAEITVQASLGVDAVVTSNVRDVIPVEATLVNPEIIYVAKPVSIPVVIDLPALDNAYAYDIDSIDVTPTVTQASAFNSKRVSVIDVAVTSTNVEVQNAADAQLVDISAVPVELPKLVRIVDVGPIDISITQPPVITYFSKRVGVIDTTSAAIVPLDLAHRFNVPQALPHTVQPAALPKLQKIIKLTAISISVTLPPASVSSFDEDPINITVQITEVVVGFSVENFEQTRRLPTTAFTQPTRFIAQDILTKRFLHWELPVSNPSIQYTLSGAKVITGSFLNESVDFRDLGLEPWGTWIHVEEAGQIRGSGILQAPKQDDQGNLEFEAIGVSAYPAGIAYLGEYSRIGVDPAEAMREIWRHIQAPSYGNLGVIVRGSTAQRLGKAAYTEPVLDEDGKQRKDDKGVGVTREVEAAPYQLMFWEAPDCGAEIASLAKEGPFDYVERDVWNSTKTDVLHYIDIGYPRIGKRQVDLRFAQEENVRDAIGPEEDDDYYASEVIFMGKGEGRTIIRGYAGRPFRNRLRRTAIVDDATVDNVPRANAMAARELDSRQAVLDIKELEIDARHSNARLGTYAEGDDIFITADVPHYGRINQWERILTYTYFPDEEIVRMQLKRSDAFTYGGV